MKNKELMSEEAFNELIDNLEIVEKLTLYGRRSIKYHVRKLQDELKGLEDVKEIMNTDVKELVDLKNIKKIKDENWRLQTKINEKDKEIEKYKYLYQKSLDNTVSADRQIVNLKKQIKEMAKYIAKEDVSETFCDYKTVCDQNCEECIEAYFREEREDK